MDVPFSLAPSSLTHLEGVPSNIKSNIEALLESSRDFREKHDWACAECCASGAVETCEYASHHVGLAVSQLHLADVYREVGELGRALELCEQAHQTFKGQTRIQRQNEAAAAYAQGLLHELQLFGDEMRALHWYQEALRLFDAAQEYWATQNDRTRIEICKNAWLWIKEQEGRILDNHSRSSLWKAVFDIWRPDSPDAPFAPDRHRQGHVTADGHVEVDGSTYRFHFGNLPEEDTGNDHYYFALRVPEDHWAVSETKTDDYVFVRQQWKVDPETVGGLWEPGVVWEPGKRWLAVTFTRNSEGKIRFYISSPSTSSMRVIGDPTGKLKGCITALLRPATSLPPPPAPPLPTSSP
jgi:hypothetical protein